ncbi:hypothetical protein TNCV_2073131 [Trichonephila clavipes]|uniref:Uncharacterized protein n=1 Tax=Trichonephila clavipes TaxID=2585209 RepID=A0A8X6RH96_TRICX|nr:hypothetical protein TNCV_2073131 [Trichonephila clavipes]
MVDQRFIPRHNPKQKVIAILMKIDNMIKAIRRITIDGVEEEFGITHERAQTMQSPELFLDGFLKLTKRYDKSSNVLGTCVINKVIP